MQAMLMRMLWQRSGRPWVLGPPQHPLQFPPDHPVGLYLHIPFCRQLCSFCPYVKFRWDAEHALAVKATLLREIHLRGTEHQGLPVSSVYFGGGTPALFLPWLGEILDALSNHFILPAARGIELHPDDIDPSVLQSLRQLSFDRISLGIQSFHDQHIQSLGRSPVEARAFVYECRSAGFPGVDVDLIFGLPGQTAFHLAQELRWAVESGATQVSTYPLIRFSGQPALGPTLRYRQQQLLLDAVIDQSQELGWQRLAVWAFGRPNTPAYTSITRPLYLGFGPSAVSLDIHQMTLNTFSLTNYQEQLKAGSLPTAYALPLSPRMRRMIWIFWQAYQLHLPGDDFLALFGHSLESTFPSELALALRLGYLVSRETGYALTRRGTHLYHRLEQSFTHRYIDHTWRVARVDPPPQEIRLF